MIIFKLPNNLLSKFKIKSVTQKFSFCSFKSLQFLHPRNYTFPSFGYLSSSNVTFVKYFSFNSGKVFQEVENEYAHGIMENLKDYSCSLLRFPIKAEFFLKSEKLYEQSNVFDEFAKVTNDNIAKGETLENAMFSYLVKNICSSLPEASDDAVQRTLHYLCLWPPTSKTITPNFKALWNTLDKECVKRIKNWDVSRQLLIADYWFHLRLSRITRYNREFIFNMLKSCESFSNKEIVQLMFYVNLQRKLPDIFLPNLEKKLESVVDSITIDELGIICLAFFKTESKLCNKALIHTIIKQLFLKLDNVNTITSAAILKFLKKSFHNSLIDAYICVLHKSIPNVKKWDIPTNVHLALLSSECNVYHPLLLDSVSNKLANAINESRLKDCTKLFQCFAHFNHFPTDKFHYTIFSEIQKAERQNEINSYPKDIVYISLYYAYMGHFNYDVLAKIFQKHFFELTCSVYPEIVSAFVEIDYSIEIECKDYFGPRMRTFYRNVLAKRRGNLPTTSSNQTMQTRLLVNVYDGLVEILGSDKNVLIRHILPHIYSPDIIVRLNSSNEKSLKEVCSTFPSDVVLHPPKNEIWVCFVICGIYSFAYRSKQITGVTAMKLRQLKKLGYHVVFIPFFDFPQNSCVRKKFLKEQLDVFKGIHAN